MKKVFLKYKQMIIGIFIGIFIFGTVEVAADTLNASSIEYRRNDNVTTVDAAINDLYENYHSNTEYTNYGTERYNAGETKGHADKNSFSISFVPGSIVLDNGGSLTIRNLTILVNGINVTSLSGGSLGSLCINSGSSATVTKTAYASYNSKVTAN